MTPCIDAHDHDCSQKCHNLFSIPHHTVSISLFDVNPVFLVVGNISFRTVEIDLPHRLIIYFFRSKMYLIKSPVMKTTSATFNGRNYYVPNIRGLIASFPSF